MHKKCEALASHFLLDLNQILDLDPRFRFLKLNL